jgi:putative redox protein
MRVEIRHLQGLTFMGRGETGASWVPLDGPTDKGGSASGSRPMELLLIGLGGCSGMDVYSILAKMRQPVAGFSIDIDGEREEDYPKPFNKVHLVYHVYGDGLDEDKVREAVRLSEERYCGAMASLKAGFSSEVRIRPADERPGLPPKRKKR